MSDQLIQRLRSTARVPGAAERLAPAFSRSVAAKGEVDAALRIVDTPLGGYIAVATPRGLVAFESGSVDDVAEQVAVALGPRVVEADTKLTLAVARQVGEYFEGRRKRFTVPLDWSLTDGFRRAVLQHLALHVGFGETTSYGELAAEAGSPRAARAVGGAMGSNPLPIVVPCHRVLAANGALGGYGGGLDRKIHLLRLEGVDV